MRNLTRTQREPRTQRERRALDVKVRVFPFVSLLASVSFVTFVSFAAVPSVGVGAARNGVIRGRVEVRRVMPQVERRPGAKVRGR